MGWFAPQARVTTAGRSGGSWRPIAQTAGYEVLQADGGDEAVAICGFESRHRYLQKPFAAQEFQKTGLVNPAVRTRRKADQQAAGPKRFRPLRTVIGWPFTTPF